MNIKLKKAGIYIFAPFLIAAAATGCTNKRDNSVFDDVVYRENYDSVYEKIGKAVTVDMVEESADGRAFVTYENKKYELGMDFLSMAMVYNTKPTTGFATPTDVYNEWWRLFMQRWNLLVPEVPLYSNQYYDVYNAKINALKTTPYWSVTDAIVGAKIVSGDNSVILGSNTELSGAFRNASFGKSAPGAADLAVQTLTSGYSTVFTDQDGGYQWAGGDILSWHTQTENADGTKTFTMRIADDLTFSDGSPIRAENYVIPLLVGSSKVMREAGGGEAAGQTLVGYKAFNAYTGEGEAVPFSGVRLLDEYTFSVTVEKEYADYYYAIRYGEFSPLPTALYGGRYALKDDGQGAYMEKDFYKKIEKNGITSYEMADIITQNLSKLSEKDFPYSGPYIVENYDAATRVATRATTAAKPRLKGFRT